MSGIAAFLDGIRERDRLAHALRHHERLPWRPAARASELPPAYRRLDGIAPVLAARGIASLYSHQVRALELLDAGRDVVLATPTASGKTLVYNLPVLRELAEDPEARALYLFPLKALEWDQRKGLEADLRAAGLRRRVAIYDGDTKPGERRKLRERPPNVLITTPDMLHLGILPHHAAWEHFFRKLRCVVVDELHSYRGIFGSQVAQVLRRLDRVARFHGARPRFVGASATVANPGELASGLVGRPFAVVQEDGSPKTERHVLLFRPSGSPYTAAVSLFQLALEQGLRTIAFTKARLVTELMHTWVADARPELAPRISSYRAGFLPSERREIERRLFSGELLGVISTSALEMGIDVGGLDVCILVGYPGSQIATWQRAGRVGRAREAAIALVAMPDALDQYLVAHPKVFFERGFEHAVIDPHNREIAAAHLPCAAAELPLRPDEPWLAEAAARANLEALEQGGKLLRSETGDRWFAARRLPHRDVSLRDSGAGFEIVEESGGPGEKPIAVGSVGAGRVQAECHEGAIYLHRGRQFLVSELALDEGVVRVRPVRAAFTTRALSEKDTEVLSRERARPCGNLRVVQGRVRVTTRVTGFERRRVHGQEVIATESLDLPPTSFETAGLWLEFPEEIPAAVRADGRHPMGGLHAVEHAALSLFPLFALCDRHDAAGISTVQHPQLRRPAIFLYDAHAGGVGLVTSLFERVEALLDATLDLVQHCPCEEGCPGCVHSPRCGSGNRPIDKAAAVQVLRLALARDPLPALAESEAPAAASLTPVEVPVPAPPPTPRPVFLDLETQRSAEDVGGWHNAHLMRVAVGVLFDAAGERFESFAEAGVPALLERLRAADLVVGFNVLRFDYRVLRGYTEEDLSALPTFDLCEAVRRRIGFRLGLGHLAAETLGAGKSADGLQSLRWWKEGRVAEIEAYCRRDVALLRDLFAFATERGFLLFRTRSGERVRIPTPWSAGALLEEWRAEQALRGEPGRRLTGVAR